MIRLMRNHSHSSIEIQISHIPTKVYQYMTYDDYYLTHIFNKNKFNALDDLLDDIALTSMGSRAFDIKPRYWRVFDDLMHQLFYSEFTPGKLWG